MKAHICIGGPLHGTHAFSDDFWRDGKYAELRQEYVQFNHASPSYNIGRYGRSRAAVVWIHVDELPPSLTRAQHASCYTN